MTSFHSLDLAALLSVTGGDGDAPKATVQGRSEKPHDCYDAEGTLLLGRFTGACPAGAPFRSPPPVAWKF
jgi:hypothetical protein